MSRYLTSNPLSNRKANTNRLFLIQKSIINSLKKDHNRNIKDSFIFILQYYCSQIIVYTIIGILKIKTVRKIYGKFSNIVTAFSSSLINTKIYSEQIASFSKLSVYYSLLVNDSSPFIIILTTTTNIKIFLVAF